MREERERHQPSKQFRFPSPTLIIPVIPVIFQSVQLEKHDW